MTVNLTRQEARAILAKPKRSKYGNVKVTINGITFDSGKEADRYLVLKAKEAAGEISHLELQPVIRLYSGTTPVRGVSGRHLFYKADFRYFDTKKDALVIEDSKGFKTDVYKLKKALVQAMMPGLEILET
jgi:hypothetical protein